ncbi:MULTISPECIES: spore coat U domain-containing protein [unclassified Rhizobium]|uniref:Csu type fimbrial protein n=1 Tax=unclassified Rhizobium TaxID=2613769 RepID=UPI0018ED616B
MQKMLRRAILVGVATIIAAPSVMAATATGNMTVTITIQSQCTIQTVGNLNFGNSGVITADIAQTATIGVQCTSGSTYNVGLSAGAAPSATVTTRQMVGTGAATINYGLYRDSGHTQNWGVTIGTDTVAGTGNGSVQNLTVYGLVPPQSTPAAGVYTDTVAITVTY